MECISAALAFLDEVVEVRVVERVDLEEFKSVARPELLDVFAIMVNSFFKRLAAPCAYSCSSVRSL